MKNKIKIVALTGIRSEYDLLFPLLEALEKDDAFDLGIIVSGAHLSPLHNYSVKQIEEDGFRVVDRIENLLYSDSLSSKAKSAAILLQGLTQSLAREEPDFLIVLGDREEAIVGALSAGFMNIPVMHFAGGDNTHPSGGNIDEQIRHAVTKMSHLHFTMTEEHSQRIYKLGEEPWRVHMVGNGGVDRIRMVDHLSNEELSARVGHTVPERYAVVIYHPLNSNLISAGIEMEICIKALLEAGLHIFIGNPNSDPGYQSILKVIQAHSHNPKIHTYSNLDRVTFVNLLRKSSCLVGNSSLGIHEAPYLCLPVINVGERQRGRRAGRNVQFVNANYTEVKQAIYKAVYDEGYRKQLIEDKYLYGDGHMAQKTLEIIKRLPKKSELLAKKITY